MMNVLESLISVLADNFGELIISAIFAVLGYALKRVVDSLVSDSQKRKIIIDCVLSVEQVYKQLHGSDKLDKAMKSAASLLSEKGICVSEEELTTLIESALAGFNGAFGESDFSE